MTRQAAKNRALLLTPTAPAAIAVVRIFGPDVPAFLAAHFSKNAKVGRAVHGDLSDGSRGIDDPVVVLLPDAAGADINLHGGPWVVQSLLDLAQESGFEIIPQAQSDTMIELLDGDTLLEKEVAAAIPLARTTLALRVVLEQPRAWREFAAGSPSADEIRRVLADQSLRHLLHPPTLAIVGAANVGKSTLANQLFEQERSITADMAGTTRDWVGEIANIDGLAVMLIDTPGLRKTEDEIEWAAIERSRGRVRSADLVVLVLDATRRLDPEQSPLLAAFPSAMRVLNKCDQPWAWECPDIAAIHTVATTGEGVDALRRAIAAHFGCAEIDVRRPQCWTERQRKVLENGDAASINSV